MSPLYNGMCSRTDNISKLLSKRVVWIVSFRDILPNGLVFLSNEEAPTTPLSTPAVHRICQRERLLAREKHLIAVRKSWEAWFVNEEEMGTEKQKNDTVWVECRTYLRQSDEEHCFMLNLSAASRSRGHPQSRVPGANGRAKRFVTSIWNWKPLKHFPIFSKIRMFWRFEKFLELEPFLYSIR